MTERQGERVCVCKREGDAEFSKVRVLKGVGRWEFEVTFKCLGSTYIYGLPEVKYCPWCGGLLAEPTE